MTSTEGGEYTRVPVPVSWTSRHSCRLQGELLTDLGRGSNPCRSRSHPRLLMNASISCLASSRLSKSWRYNSSFSVRSATPLHSGSPTYEAVERIPSQASSPWI